METDIYYSHNFQFHFATAANFQKQLASSSYCLWQLQSTYQLVVVDRHSKISAFGTILLEATAV